MQRASKIQEPNQETAQGKEVVAENVGNGEISWKKIGGGSFLFRGKRILPGNVFMAREDEIKPAFRKLVVPQAPLTGKETRPVNIIQNEYALKQRDDEGLEWDVVNVKSGKPLNDKPLSKDKAAQFIKDLTS